MLLPGASASASEGGLVITPDLWKSLILLVIFLVLVPLLNTFLFRPLLRVLREREERIAGAKKQADRLFKESETILARYEEAVRDARTNAEAERKSELAATRRDQLAALAAERTEAERGLERARQEIVEALQSARVQLRLETEALAHEAASRILGRSIG